MAHISSIGAAIYTDLSVAIGPTTAGVAAASLPATMNKTGFDSIFNTTSTSDVNYMQIPNVREFPAVGASPNIVNVPIYGQKTAQTVSGQSDPPSLEVTVNYIGSEWAKGVVSTTWVNNVVATRGNELANMVGDGVKRAWRFTLLLTQPTGAALGAAQSQFDSNAGGLGLVENSMYYFLGKLESLLVTPSLTDSTTAKLSFSIQSDFYGAYTV